MSREQLVQMARRGIHHLQEGTQSQVDEVYRVPVSSYTDPARWQVEVDRIFKRLPLVLGFSCELQEPGSYRAMDVVGMPVLLVRGEDGAIRAFVNTCSHRGAQLVDEGVGLTKRFTCPYHAWSYDTSGDLVRVYDSRDFGEIDMSCHGLTPLPVSERAGLIWAVLRPGATVDFDRFLCGYDELLAHHHFDQCRLVGRQTLVGANWKVAYDGYLDYYHLPVLHMNSFGSDISCKAIYTAFGPHQRVAGPDRHHEALAKMPEDEWTEEMLVGGVWTIFPHVSIAAFDAGGKIYMVSQLFPGNTVDESVTVQNFLHTQPDAPGQAELIAQRMAFLMHVVRDEDYKTGIRIQRGLKTGAKPYVMFGRNEGGGQRFHGWVEALVDTIDEDVDKVFATGVEIHY
jgi:phenylpropionate dioxygenase-like ring-hydroxylating dioxygenase large terminal subunit